ncbi:MAG TPA: hypothetical protein VG934_03615 [Candidatus Paceibacterota bacterium]|nr:hypothetical protein [Candidatus Paceibacterota bacterium]
MHGTIPPPRHPWREPIGKPLLMLMGGALLMIAGLSFAAPVQPAFGRFSSPPSAILPTPPRLQKKR